MGHVEVQLPCCKEEPDPVYYETTHCVRAVATDEDGNTLPVTQINEIGNRGMKMDFVDVYGMPNATVYVNYTVSEKSISTLDRFEILVSNHVDMENAPLSEDAVRCVRYSGPLTEGKTVELACDKIVRGRYVTIANYEIESNYYEHYLSLCDLQIYGTPVYLHLTECMEDEECQRHGDKHLVCHMEGCVCQQGFHYAGTNSNLCVDVDECEDQLCSHDCVNTVGSYHCECPHGLVLDIKGHHCIDENECDDKYSRCDHDCLNHLGGLGYQCSCYPGYELQEDGHTCTDINECECENKCEKVPHVSCSNTPGSYQCLCPYKELGVVWEDGQCTAEDAKSFCDMNNGLCEHKCHHHGGYFFDTTCSCGPGYELAEDGKSCLDINECLDGNGGCSDTCVNTPGHYKCLCSGGAVPFKYGKHCVSSSRVVVVKFHLSMKWKTHYSQPHSTEAVIVAKALTSQLQHVMMGQLESRPVVFEVLHFFEGSLGVQLGAIYGHDVTIEEQRELLLALSDYMSTASFYVQKDRIRVVGGIAYIDMRMKDMGQAYPLHSTCAVYEVLYYCHPGGDCFERGGIPACRCRKGYGGQRCEKSHLLYEPLTDNEFHIVMGIVGIAVFMVIVAVVTCCCCRKSSTQRIVVRTMPPRMNPYPAPPAMAPKMNPYQAAPVYYIRNSDNPNQASWSDPYQSQYPMITATSLPAPSVIQSQPLGMTPAQLIKASSSASVMNDTNNLPVIYQSTF